jgi:hypothetical protein
MNSLHQSRNIWSYWLWIVEVAYAVIAGVYESYMYSAYAPASGWATAEAGIRATITQVFVILLGRAGVAAYEAAGGGIGGWIGSAIPNLFSLIFAVPAMWLMHETALQFRQDAMLSVAQSQPTPIADLLVSGREIDPWLIAMLPILLVVVNVFAPLITRDRRLLSAAEIALRSASRVAMINAKNAERAASLVGLASTARSVAKRAFSDDKPADLPLEVEPVLVPITSSSQPLNAPTAKPKGRRADQWTYAELLAEASKRAIPMSETEARNIIKTRGKGLTLEGDRGAPYVAHKLSVLSYMRSRYRDAYRPAERAGTLAESVA